MDAVIFKETLIGMGAEKPNETKELSKILTREVLYVEEAPDMMLIIIRNTFPGEKINKLTKRCDKKVRIVGINELQRLMLGLLNNKEKFLNIGFLESIDFKTRQMTISTGLKDLNLVKFVVFGYLRIDNNGNEIGSRKIGTF
jgi:polynucleotide 5'-kinase involved in rRNA processing